MWDNLPIGMKWALGLTLVICLSAITVILVRPPEEPETVTLYLDKDKDGFGCSITGEFPAKKRVEGYTDNSDDCDDARDDVSPGALEVCDFRDNDCNSLIDEGFEKFAFHRDADGDGYGDFENAVVTCRKPRGYVEDATDPDDTDPNIPEVEEVQESEEVQGHDHE